jgi:hypothetical protein
MPEAQANLNIIFISNIRDYVKFNDKNDKIVFLIQIDGEYLSNWNYRQYCRYHLVISTVSRETLPIQDMVCCDYFRTPVIFQVPDIFVFVGDSTGSKYPIGQTINIGESGCCPTVTVMNFVATPRLSIQSSHQ